MQSSSKFIASAKKIWCSQTTKKKKFLIKNTSCKKKAGAANTKKSPDNFSPRMTYRGTTSSFSTHTITHRGMPYIL
jgi:hypothetical protein